jgi:hypothetical protein
VDTYPAAPSAGREGGANSWPTLTPGMPARYPRGRFGARPGTLPALDQVPTRMTVRPWTGSSLTTVASGQSVRDDEQPAADPRGGEVAGPENWRQRTGLPRREPQVARTDGTADTPTLEARPASLLARVWAVATSSAAQIPAPGPYGCRWPWRRHRRGRGEGGGEGRPEELHIDEAAVDNYMSRCRHENVGALVELNQCHWNKLPVS